MLMPIKKGNGGMEIEMPEPPSRKGDEEMKMITPGPSVVAGYHGSLGDRKEDEVTNNCQLYASVDGGTRKERGTTTAVATRATSHTVDPTRGIKGEDTKKEDTRPRIANAKESMPDTLVQATTVSQAAIQITNRALGAHILPPTIGHPEAGAWDDSTRIKSSELEGGIMESMPQPKGKLRLLNPLRRKATRESILENPIIMDRLGESQEGKEDKQWAVEGKPDAKSKSQDNVRCDSG